ncbi:MAG: PspA/IM30 family protein [Candidatus Latescibacteria bacterium]|nr:PspA/IM30 family protein [Candidatus Latescibacterota bacterium]
MAFWDRIKRMGGVVGGEVDSTIERVEYARLPQTLERAVHEKEDVLRKAKEGYHTALAAKKRIERSIGEYKQKVTKSHQSAVRALEVGKETLAQKFLEEENKARGSLDQFQAQSVAHDPVVVKAREAVSQVQAALNQILLDRDTMLSQKQQADARKVVNRTLAGLESSGSATATMDRMKRRLEQETDSAEALEVMAGENKSLDDELQEAETATGSSAALSALKAELAGKKAG